MFFVFHVSFQDKNHTYSFYFCYIEALTYWKFKLDIVNIQPTGT